MAKRNSVISASSLDSQGEDTYFDYVIVMSKSSGRRKFAYMMIDPVSRTISPKVNKVTWPRLADLVDYRACVVKSCLYVIGGRELNAPSTYLKQVLRYDPNKNRWTECARMKKARVGHSAVVMSERIYVCGGATAPNELTDTCESYDPSMDEWQSEDQLPGSRKDHACVVKENVMYLTGGASPTQNANDNFWVFKLSQSDKKEANQPSYVHMWHVNLKPDVMDPEAKSLIPNKLAKHTTLLVKEKVYCFGGVCHGFSTDAKHFVRHSGDELQESPSKAKRHLGTSYMMDCYRLKAQPNKRPVDEDSRKSRRSWLKNVPDMPQARSSAATIVVGNKIYLIGGHMVENEEGTSINEVEYYHTKKATWTPAFHLGEGNFRDVDCVTLSVPLRNRDFRPTSFPTCRWVMW